MFSIYEPLYTLKAIDEDIWIVDGEIVEMNFKEYKCHFNTQSSGAIGKY